VEELKLPGGQTKVSTRFLSRLHEGQWRCHWLVHASWYHRPWRTARGTIRRNL